MTTEIVYKFGAKDYLDRARIRLSETNPESLFYAALELRIGIDILLNERIDAQAQIKKMKRDGWEMSGLAKYCEAAFDSRETAIRFTIFDFETGNEICTVLYAAPVTHKLEKLRVWLNSPLHSPDKKLYENQQWLTEFRKKLDDTFFMLDFALSETLLALPLSHPKYPDIWFFCQSRNQTNPIPYDRKIKIQLATRKIEEILLASRSRPKR